MDSPKIYIVDDSEDYSFLIKQIFHKFLPEYDVSFFAGGEMLLRRLFLPLNQNANELPSLVLLDLNMPVISGYQTLKLLKTTADPNFGYLKQIPVIIMSNEENIEQVADCYRAGANAFLKKPIEFNDLKELLKSVCYFWLQVNKGPDLKRQ